VYNLTVSYNPTVSTAATVLRARPFRAASQTLREWFAEEATGYQVACHDESGVSVTKAQLREITRRA
jgi:hypothetical protein